MEKVNLADEAAKVTELWGRVTPARFNDYEVHVNRIKGEYAWMDARLAMLSIRGYVMAGEDFASSYRAVWRHDPAVPRKLHQVTSDARVRGVLDHPLPGRQRDELAEHERRSGGIDRQHCKLHWVGAFG